MAETWLKIARECRRNARFCFSQSEKVSPETLSRVEIFLVHPITKLQRITFSCIHTEFRSSKLSHKMWLRCAGGSKERLKKYQIFLRMFGSECWLCQQQELCGMRSFRNMWSPSETTAFRGVHCVGCHIETWHNQIVLVWERCWGDRANKEHYIVVLNKFWGTLSTSRAVQGEKQWFQQDVETPQTAHITFFGGS